MKYLLNKMEKENAETGLFQTGLRPVSTMLYFNYGGFMFLNKFFAVIIIASTVMFLNSCSEENANQPIIKSGNLEVQTVTDLAADVNGVPGADPTYTYFRFKDGVTMTPEIAGTNWDIAFAGTTIKTNDNCGVKIVDGETFNSFATAPESGYAPSTKINWYSYNPANHQISSIAGMVIVFKTAEGKYAKMRVLSYYKGNPPEYQQTDIARYYTFEYVYQPDGTRNF